MFLIAKIMIVTTNTQHCDHFCVHINFLLQYNSFPLPSLRCKRKGIGTKACLPLVKGGGGMFHRTSDAMRTEHPPSPLHKGEVKVSTSILLPCLKVKG